MKSRERTPFGARLKAAREACGFTQQQVTDAIGVPQSTLGEAEKTGKGASKWLVKLAALYGVAPEYLSGELDSELPASTGVARLTSLIPLSVPKLLSWEALQVGNDLPGQFRLTVEDDAMGDRFPKGSYVEFDSTLDPRAGDVVLLCDRAGEHYIRWLREKRRGEFVATAENPAYLPLDLKAERLTIRAVLIGAGWSGRLAP